MECFRHFQSDAVGVDPVGPAFAIKAQGWDNRNDPLLEEEFEGVIINPLHPSGEELVRASENAGWVSNDGIGIRGPEVNSRKSLHDPIGQPDSRIDRDLQGGVTGDTGTIAIGDRDAAFFCEFFDLVTCPVDQDNPDAQRAQYGEVEQDVREVLRSHNGAVDRNHEDPLPEAGYILEDFSKIGNVHGRVNGEVSPPDGAINL